MCALAVADLRVADGTGVAVVDPVTLTTAADAAVVAAAGGRLWRLTGPGTTAADGARVAAAWPGAADVAAVLGGGTLMDVVVGEHLCVLRAAVAARSAGRPVREWMPLRVEPAPWVVVRDPDGGPAAYLCALGDDGSYTVGPLVSDLPTAMHMEAALSAAAWRDVLADEDAAAGAPPQPQQPQEALAAAFAAGAVQPKTQPRPARPKPTRTKPTRTEPTRTKRRRAGTAPPGGGGG